MAATGNTVGYLLLTMGSLSTGVDEVIFRALRQVELIDLL